MRISRELFIKVQLHKQGLTEESRFKDPLTLLKNLGYIQLDSINVVSRSQDIFLWSRIKGYKKQDLISLYNKDSVFETYLFALCLMPMEAKNKLSSLFKRSEEILFNDQEIDSILDVFNQIKQNQNMKTGDFNYEHIENVEPWKLTPIKIALDRLWRANYINVKRDNNFNKIYSPSVNISELKLEGNSDHNMYKYLIDKTFENLGIATIKEAKQYLNLNKSKVEEILVNMIKNDELVPIRIIGFEEEHYIRIEDVDLLDELEKIEQKQSTLLTPFDNMLRDRSRVFKLFNVDYRLESYLPKKQRKYGYFGLPVLVDGRIIGVIDLKHERAENILYVNNITLFYTMEKKIHINEINNIISEFSTFLGTHKVISKEHIII